MNLVERVKKILLQPQKEWEVISGEITNTAELYKNYIVLLAAIGPIASIIGMSVVGVSMPFIGTYRLPLASTLGSAVVQYILNLIGVYVLALIIDYLAPQFSGEKNFNQSLKLAAYSFTAGWISSVFGIIPTLGPLMILGLYGLYLIYTGIPIMMKAPKEKALGYTVAVVIAAIIIAVVIGWASRLFISYPVPGAGMQKITEKAARDMGEAAKKIEAGLSKMPQSGVMTAEQQKQIEEATQKVQEAMKGSFPGQEKK
jgi:hypothetical protein